MKWRIKYAIGDEIKVLEKLSEKYMSDEETDVEDDKILIHWTLPWRSPKLNKLIEKLDRRYRRKKDDLRPLKPRKDGEPSNRPLPNNYLSWAITTDVAASVGDQEHQIVAPISVEVPDDEEVVHNEESNFAESSDD